MPSFKINRLLVLEKNFKGFYQIWVVWSSWSCDPYTLNKLSFSCPTNAPHVRTSDGGNRSHNVSLPFILKKTKVIQILQYSCISLLLVPILLYWIQVSVSLNVLLYFGAEMATFCIKHIENRKIFFNIASPPPRAPTNPFAGKCVIIFI